MNLDTQQSDGFEVTITYRNYRGETAERRIIPRKIWFGSTEWHPERQWMMDAIDVEKNAVRSFAMNDFLDFDSLLVVSATRWEVSAPQVPGRRPS